MYSDHDPRFSQARTDTSYNTMSPNSLPPPLPAGLQSNLSLGPSITSTPRGSSADPFRDAYPDREITATPNNNSAPLLPISPQAAYKDNAETSPYAGAALRNAGGYPYANVRGSTYSPKPPLYKRPAFLIGMAALLVAVVVAVVVPVVLVNHHNSSSKSTSAATSQGSQTGDSGGGGNGNGNGGGGKGSTTNLATWGGDGSTVTTDDGSTFVYKNSFGGIWVSDPANPFNNSAKPNSWTPALSEKWTWGVDRVNGVNLGGLFVLEPFISPALFEAYSGTQDEWHLSQAVSSSGNLTDFLVQHYTTFVTEQDIAEIAGAGLNWIRLPIPFWAIETWNDVGSDDPPNGPEVAEPFLAKVCWQYILRVIGWARKYGIRVNLDLHAVPGSQNGYNHSGKLGQINFMNGVMGYANAQRTLDYIRAITEFITQSEYTDVIPIFSIVNEALLSTIGQDQMTSFYLQAHDMIRSITGVGEGHGPFMAIHDGFRGLSSWANFLPGSDRILMDTHPYFAFDDQPNTAPIDVPAVGGDGTMMGGPWPQQACNGWGDSLNASRQNFGVTIAGEFSNAINDCGLYIRGVGNGPVYSGDCTVFNNWASWSDDMKNGFQNFLLASMDSLGDWFFWTWKIGNDTTTNSVQAPLWSYQLGLENGWIAKDPRQAHGMCAKLGVVGTPFDGTFQSWQTGGAGAGTIAPSATSQFGQFPPTDLAGVPTGQVPLIPSYTANRSPVTLPPPSYTTSLDKGVSTGNGWFDSQDTAPMVTPVSACVYPDAWNAQSSPVPATACGATANAAPAPSIPPSVPAVPPATSASALPTSSPATPALSTSSAAGVVPPVRARKGSSHH